MLQSRPRKNFVLSNKAIKGLYTRSLKGEGVEGTDYSRKIHLRQKVDFQDYMEPPTLRKLKLDEKTVSSEVSDRHVQKPPRQEALRIFHLLHETGDFSLS